MQHYDRRGQYDVALSKIDEAMQHTPTVIDLYSVKVGLAVNLQNFAVASFAGFYIFVRILKKNLLHILNSLAVLSHIS